MSQSYQFICRRFALWVLTGCVAAGTALCCNAEDTSSPQNATPPEAGAAPLEGASETECAEGEVTELSIEEKLSMLLGLAEVNPLAELLEEEKAVAQKETVEEEEEEEEEAEEDTGEADKKKRAGQIAQEMQLIRYEVAKNNLYIKLAQACRRCETCSCYKHYSSEYHRTFRGPAVGWSHGQWVKRKKSCTHSLSGEIGYLNSRGAERLYVRFDLPNSPQRLLEVNRAVSSYKRLNRELYERYSKLKARMDKLGARYEDFGLRDKSETARVLPPGVD